MEMNTLEAGGASAGVPGALTQSAAADRIASLFDDDLNKIEITDSPEPSAEVEEQSNDGPEPENAPDEPSAEEESEAPATTEPDEIKVRLRNGKEVSIAELKKGYLEPEEFTRRTTEIEQTRAALAQQQAAIAQRAQFFEQTIGMAIAVAQANIPPAPSEELLQSDPLGYVQAKAAHDNALAKLNQLRTAQQAHAVQSRQQHEQAQAEYVAREREALRAAMPELKDETKAKDFYSRLVTFAQKHNFSAEDVSRVYDHRLIPILDKAMKWDEHAAKQAELKVKAETKVAEAPPVQAPGRRMAPAEARQAERQAKFQQLRKSGREADAVSLIKDLL